MKRYLKLLALILLISWIGLIFYFSSQGRDISNIQSNSVLEFAKKLDQRFDIGDTWVYKVWKHMVLDRFWDSSLTSGNALIRKSAHFGIYAILGAISMGLGYIYSRRYLFGAIFGILIPIVIAFLDEYNQSFVGRGASLKDVALDGLGAVTGTFTMLVFILIFKAMRSKK